MGKEKHKQHAFIFFLFFFRVVDSCFTKYVSNYILVIMYHHHHHIRAWLTHFFLHIFFCLEPLQMNNAV